MGKSKIGWVTRTLPNGEKIPGYTLNLWEGCSKVSPACQNCYAEKISNRFGGDYWGPGKPRKIFKTNNITQNLGQWNAASRKAGAQRFVFVNSMSDLFEDNVSVRYARELFFHECCRKNDNLIFLLLTKRPENVPRMIPNSWRNGLWPKNVWMGVTAEDQKLFNERVPHLLGIPAPIRFLSIEPMLGPINLKHDEWGPSVLTCRGGDGPLYCCGFWSMGDLHFRGIDWVIAGGESGPRARPSNPQWFVHLQNQCAERGTPFYFKQWGHWQPYACRGEVTPPGVKLVGNGWELVQWNRSPRNNTLLGRRFEENPLDHGGAK